MINDPQFLALTSRAQRVVGLILWRGNPDREINVDQDTFYARLKLFPGQTGATMTERALADLINELRGSVLPNFMIRVGDNDLGEQEQILTITY
ncbi:hypothetical protein [Lacticaseibacillus pantheris]|jgi:hypothetical protein|uniref:Uncharacterized protein n=1 Tax=Lacticaseibacillus pantheris DSM 15945 = JCM 12539 = NBRC 106106 TaxID=1423783 RepID=A0A0R1U4L2_9LACO|nr:hypothetical protein [Lacticaseibacillus pantheris]KRL88177.1 hypothetical protein FC50_GL000375 [Lacticaseibacillus pantheris DSM 15945 = JCM 12539 = NBRC 106106]WKF86118.1 hypothetical protein QY874_05995 [Lacticaseibacillus pantheris]